MSDLTPDEIAKKVEEMMTPELQALAKMIDDRLPDGWGFGLLMFPFSEPGPLLWVSNAQRQDMVKAVREWLEKQNAN